MKTAEAVSFHKIRGGFYTPPELVDTCLNRIDTLTAGRSGLHVLEPGAGDGAFIRGIINNPISRRINYVLAVEIIRSEAAKCVEALRMAQFEGHVLTDSAIRWATVSSDMFDVAIGNPPFVRYQFISDKDKMWSKALANRLGISFNGVANLWIPFLLGALSRLKPHGALAFVVPTEVFTGMSAGIVREWLSLNTEEVRIDLFPPGSFPGVLQEIAVLSGFRRQEPTSMFTTMQVFEHEGGGGTRNWSSMIPTGKENWTTYLLNPRQIGALKEAGSLPAVRRVGDVAKFEVAAVTGANEYFSVDIETVSKYGLHQWTRPLLPRIRHAKGLRFKKADHRTILKSGIKAFLLDFSNSQPKPEKFRLPLLYLALGIELGLPLRYKCSIRQPWYRVPQIRPERLMLSKRAHRFHRLVLNEAQVVTTDTIYRGHMLHAGKKQEMDFVASFHNSLTLLSAEIEGRSFGGGVLELVPREISRLLIPTLDGFGSQLQRLDYISRSTSNHDQSEELVNETDMLLLKADVGFSKELLEIISGAREVLLKRRLDRNRI